jgi:hypothetical protein
MILSSPRTTTKIYEVKLWDSNNNLISHMLPLKQNDQKGLYCSVREEFFPVENGDW